MQIGSAIIGHLDMDAFFAAVEERANPRWRGRPIVVGANPQAGQGRGVVSTANYAARVFGIHSAMPIRKAWQLAEAGRQRTGAETIFVSGSFASYGNASQRIQALLTKYIPTIERRGIDEWYFDLTFTNSYVAARELCQRIQYEIKKAEQLSCSVGIGPTTTVAKIASDHDKPNGLVVIHRDEVKAFLSPLPIRTLPGVGPATEARLHKRGVRTIGDLQQYTPAPTAHKWERSLVQRARGAGRTSVQTERRVAKSVGHQSTLRQDTLKAQQVIERLLHLCEKTWDRLPAGDMVFRTVTVTVRFADFTTLSRARSLPKPPRILTEFEQTALRLVLPFFDRRENPQAKPIRLVGVRLH